MPPALNLEGKKFGRLQVMRRATPRPKDRNVMWECKCDCGGWTVAAASNLGVTTFSCGCFAKETAAELLSKARYTQTHNMSHTLEYYSWCAMKARCQNPDNHKYHIYGARGITLCDRWNDFENFYEDMGPKPGRGYSIERLDNNGNYTPDNCIWATAKVQGQNTRANKYIEIDGKRLNILGWCEELKIKKWEVYELTRGWGTNRQNPPKCATTEDAVRFLYRKLRG